MAKQKNLSPLELKHLLKYIDIQTCTMAELAVEMGHEIDVLEKYIESLGGLKNVPVPIDNQELTPSQIRIRESFAARSGAVMMTEGASTQIEEAQGNKSFEKPHSFKPEAKSKKSDTHVFRGNKPVNPRANPDDERRI